MQSATQGRRRPFKDERFMARTEQRQIALRFGFATAGWLIGLFLLVALLSYSSADWPSHAVWPPNHPTQNLCGRVGSFTAYYALYYLGLGAYPLTVLIVAALVAAGQGARLADLWLRGLGAAILTGVFAICGALFIPLSSYWPVAGPGGVLGLVTGDLLQRQLGQTGVLILLAAAFVVGLLLAADEIVLYAIRGAGWARRQAVPVLARSGQALASAGSNVAIGVAHASGRLVSVGLGRGEVGADEDAPTSAKPRRGRSAAKAADYDEDGEYDEDEGEYDEDDEDLEYDEDEDADEEGGDEDADEEDDEEWDEEDGEEEEDGDEGEVEEDEEEYDDEEYEEEDEDGEYDDEDDPEDQADLDAVIPPAPTRARPRQGELSDHAAIQAMLGPEGGAARTAAKPRKPYDPPGLTLLEDSPAVDRRAIEQACREKAVVLEQTLNEFKLEVRVVAIETGPVITMFELKLAPGIKVSQIASLANDMARALKAPSVRVVAPLPGKNTIGIEVPNVDKEKVRIKELMHSVGKRGDDYAIPLFLGKDASGQPLVTDLTRMPHLLIAGTTGSGKSVCVASVIISILLTRSPDEVKLILVDPKVVELSIFKDIPHLMCPIVTETSKAEGILDWACTKMDERYAMLAEAGVKDIRSYNRLGPEGLRERLGIESDEELGKIPVHLPYIVIVVDELADLMMTSAKEVEFYLSRLAQKSRAVGIHLIVSTQRPQANVVTGLIKSNLPCRIAFRVSSRLDSRIVLDQNGGEVLMGQGDMLFLPPGAHKLVRAQGTFISDDELRAVVKHARTQGEPEFHPELVRSPDASGVAGERDELFDPAVEVVIQSNRGSVSLLQRKLTIGYSRASRLIEQMYEAGIVGEYKGSQAREVLVTLDEWQRIRSQRDAADAEEQELA